MPPLPQNGTFYPPSSSAYEPLPHRPIDEPNQDLEDPSPFGSSRITQRTFTFSPYSSNASNPNDLLHTFLADTRNGACKELMLRIRLRTESGSSSAQNETVIDLPLPRLADHDSQPYAVADDMPCLRGLPENEPWGVRARRLADELLGHSELSTHYGELELPRNGGEQLQVYNAYQSKALYATAEEVTRYRQRTQVATTRPPWTPLNDDLLPSSGASSKPATRKPSEQTDEQQDARIAELLSGASGDFDLSVVFHKSRERRATRLVSTGLQQALERFADDRHFSKYLVCRQVVWGWNMDNLKTAIARMAIEAQSQYPVDAKGKSRAVDMEAIEVQLQVVGLESAPIYHVVWKPIAFLNQRFPSLFKSRTALRWLTLFTTSLVAATLVGMLSNTLLILLGLAVVVGWAGLMRLIRTQARCVYDTIGTAWCLAPRWERIMDADASCEYDTVYQRLKSRIDDAGEWKIENRGDKGWYLRRGIDEQQWVQLHRERILHLFNAHQSQ